MKKKRFWYYCLVPLVLLLIGSCRPGENLFGKCKKQLPNLLLRVVVFDSEKRNYFEANPNITWENFMIYDENWDYAKWNYVSYEDISKRTAFIPDNLYIDFDYPNEPYGVDRVKVFYFKYDTDIDTLRIEYKPKNECRHLDYFRVYYNGDIVELSVFEDLYSRFYDRIITKK